MEDISTLFAHGQFRKLVGKYLKSAREFKLTSDPDKRRKRISTLYYLLAACEQCGYYYDYLAVLKKYNEFSPLKCSNLNKYDLAVLLDFALESLLYCLYNKESDKLEVKYSISEQIEKVIDYQNGIIQEPGSTYSDRRKKELQMLYEDYKNGLYPIYTVEYLYPFEPIVKDYIFDLSSCYPYISMEVKKVQRDNDNYTSFKFKAHGLIKPDTFWRGPKYETQEKLPPVRKSLDIANMMLLQAVKESPGKMVLPYSINQVSTVSMFQYRWDEKEPILGGTITGTDFTADWVGGNAQWHQFTDEEMVRLNKSIVSTCSGKPFVTVFHHATNLLSGGFHLESFALLCFCMEGMIYYWFEELARIHDIKDEYMTYKETPISKCDTCEGFKSTSNEKPDKGMKPSLYANVDFLYKNNCLTKKDKKRICKLIAKIKNDHEGDNLRNKTVHGENERIDKKDVEDSLAGILELQDIFVEIINDKLKKETNSGDYP